MEEILLINEARILRDNHIYLIEQEEESQDKNSLKKSTPNFSKKSSGKPTSALGAEQALNAFQSGAWSKV